MNISVIGLGKLGSPLAAVLASKGHTVLGVDADADKVRHLAAGRAPVEEPGLAERIAGSAARLSATTDVSQAVLDTETTFVIVPTPSQPDGADLARPGARVAVLGLSYRPGTGIVEKSQGAELAAALAEAGYAVSVYDPAAMPTARRVLPGNVRFAESAAACVADAAVVPYIRLKTEWRNA
jgi:UDP-glucose 6-dehydrogenase